MADEIFKEGTIVASVSATGVSSKTTIQYTTQDNGSAKLIFHLKKGNSPVNLLNATVKLFLRMGDGSTYEKPAVVKDAAAGVVEYVLNEEVVHAGFAKGELNVYYPNGQALTVCLFSFAVQTALKDSDIVPTAEYYIKDFNSLKETLGDQIESLANEVVVDQLEGINSYSLTPTFTNGKLTKVEEKDGTQVVSSSTLVYKPDGNLQTLSKTVNGKTVVTTIVYDANGKFAGTTKEVK